MSIHPYHYVICGAILPVEQYEELQENDPDAADRLVEGHPGELFAVCEREYDPKFFVVGKLMAEADPYEGFFECPVRLDLPEPDEMLTIYNGILKLFPTEKELNVGLYAVTRYC